MLRHILPMLLRLQSLLFAPCVALLAAKSVPLTLAMLPMLPMLTLRLTARTVRPLLLHMQRLMLLILLLPEMPQIRKIMRPFGLSVWLVLIMLLVPLSVKNNWQE
jgi:hypothetical protein